MTRSEQRHFSLVKNWNHAAKLRLLQSGSLFINGHEKLGVARASGGEVMIANQETACGAEQIVNLPIKLGNVALVPDFVNGLHRNHPVEIAQAVCPIGQFKIPNHVLNNIVM